MPTSRETIAPRTASLPRFALLLGFVASLALFALLYAAKPAPATAAEPLPEDPLGLEFEEELVDGEEEIEEECEEVGEWLEECEEAKVEGEASSDSSLSEECLLRSTHARAVVDRRGEKLKLTIGYTAHEPVGAEIEIGRGASHIATLHRHLGRSGVLRIVKVLHKNQHLKRLVVRIGIPSAKRVGCPSRRLVLFPR